jgi:hypothetical protein
MSTRCLTTVSIGLLLAWSASTPVQAQGFQREVPLPFSIHQSVTAVERSFKPPVPATGTLLPSARSTMPDTLPAFFRESRVEIGVRSYYRDEVKTTTRPTVSEAWAAGGAITVETGRLFELISGGVTFYTSQPLYAPSQWGNTDLLLPDQLGYFVVGQLYGQLQLPGENVFTAGRHLYDTPFLGPQDNRMTPNTFYGYTLIGSAGDGGKGPAFNYGGGYIATMKPRASDSFMSMSRAAGSTVDRGVGVAGGLMTWGPLSLGAIEYYAQDTINIAYAEGKYAIGLPYDVTALVALQYADQRSTGANLLIGAPFSTGQFGARLQLGYGTAILTGAYSVVDASYQMQSPWSSNPFYTDAQILGYQRAGENAFQVGASYDFTPVGLTGVAAAVQFFTGWTSAIASGAPLVENEWNFALEWRPDWKPLSGLWLQARYGTAQTFQSNKITTTDEVRLVLNYKVKLY